MVMVGRKHNYGKELFRPTADNRREYNEEDEKTALRVIRYALEYYLGWGPEDAKARLSFPILRSLKLDGLVKNRIKFPPELNRTQEIGYLVSKLYPKEYPYQEKAAIEAYYSGVLNHQVERFRNGFFTGTGGAKRAAICLRYMLKVAFPFRDVDQIYECFASEEGRALLRKYGLASAARDLYPYPIDFLHYSLPENMRSEKAYHKLRAQEEAKAMQKRAAARKADYRKI